MKCFVKQLFLCIVFTVLSFSVNAQTVHRIGDTGPAGGVIFYDKGNSDDGWRFLEVAPANTEFTAEWGVMGRAVVGTSTGIGSGRQNTQILVDALRVSNERGRAAQRVRELTINGFSDWFLPSIDELNLIYTNLGQNNAGGFRNNTSSYWSSSQNDNTSFSWAQRFRDGSRGSYIRNLTLPVRAVRAF